MPATTEDAAIKTFVGDLASRALHTVWQTALPLVAVDWAASGLSLGDLNTVDGRTKAVVSVVVPVSAGVLSALKTTVVAYFKSTPDPLDAVVPVMGAEVAE